jgi:hypothetical protein
MIGAIAKRPFFCGLAAILIVDGSGMLFLGADKDGFQWGIVALVVAGCSIWAATQAPRSKTWWTAILLWIAGGVIANIPLMPVFSFFGKMLHQ